MGLGFAPTWLRQASPLLHKTTLTTGLEHIIFAAGCVPDVADDNRITYSGVLSLRLRRGQPVGDMNKESLWKLLNTHCCCYTAFPILCRVTEWFCQSVRLSRSDA